jgi:hypothetical protein
MSPAFLAHATHLVRRFFGSLWPGRPSPEGEAWATQSLLPAEQELWSLMSNSDRRHAISVARQVAAALGSRADRRVLAAALLRDVGKTVSGLGTFGRTVATLAGLIDRGRAQAWTSRTGVKRRIALYLSHPDLGADQLARAGGDPLTVAWAREHHLPENAWSVPIDIGRALNMFTREGRRGLARFLQSEAETAKWVHANIPASQRVQFLGGIVFAVEGSVLRPRLSWPLADFLRHAAEVKCHGRHCLDATEVLELMRAELPLLEEARHHVA